MSKKTEMLLAQITMVDSMSAEAAEYGDDELMAELASLKDEAFDLFADYTDYSEDLWGVH